MRMPIFEISMEQELIKMLFEITVEGNLVALKKVVEKHPNIHLSECVGQVSFIYIQRS